MARTKQTAKKSAPKYEENPYDSEASGITDDDDEGASPPKAPPLPPPSLNKGKRLLKKKGAYQELNVEKQLYLNEGTPSLTNILSPSVLLNGKKQLKNSNDNRGYEELDRKGLLVPYSPVYGSQVHSLSLRYIPEQSRLQNVTALNFNGIEQITDCFMFYLGFQKVHLPLLKRISLCGCQGLTDVGIEWMTKAFQTVEHVDLIGCKNLTEVSLYAIIEKWQSTLIQISMGGTQVGMIPNGYEGSIALHGCPLLSPTHKIYSQVSVKVSEKMNRPLTSHTCFKMVILTENSLPWSPLSILTQEPDVSAKKALRVKKNFSTDNVTYLNIFEVPLESGFGDVVLSDGCIIAIPYLVAEDGPDLDYADDIVRNIAKIFIKYPQSLFVLMPLSETDGLDRIADRYKNLISRQLGIKVKNLGSIIHSAPSALFAFHHQQKLFAHARKAFEQFDNIENVVKTGFFLQTDLLVVKKDIKKSLQKLISTTASELQRRFPAKFIKYQAQLKDAISEIGKLEFPFTDLEKLSKEMIPKNHVHANFTNYPDATIFISKILEVMGTMGKVLYYPSLHGSPALSDFGLLETLYQKLMVQEAPTRASWRFLGSNVPCWTKANLEGICSDKTIASHLITILMAEGVLIQLPRDRWTTELQEPYAYVLYKKLPFYPKIDVEEYWPEGVPEDEHQLERYYTFLPSMPDAFFPALIRQCMELGGVNLLWDKGIIIQKGPISVLLELLSDQNSTPVLFLGARMMSGKDAQEGTVWKALCCTLSIYRHIVIDLQVKLGAYTKATIPCPTCLPSKNRYKTVNARQSEVFMKAELQLWVDHIRSERCMCANEGSILRTQDLLGDDIDSLQIVPSHYYLGCLPSFSAYNRCMFCQNCAMQGPFCEGNLSNGSTAWNCSCNQEGQMCDKCGMCQRCVTFLSRLVSSVNPSFQSKGSIHSLDPGTVMKLDQDLSPNYSPRLEICFVRGSKMNLTLKMGAFTIVYDTSNGVISRYMRGIEKSSEADEQWRCKQGFYITVELRFSQMDPDNMNIVINHQMTQIYEYECSTQSCTVEINADTPMSIVINTPARMHCQPQGVDNYGEKVSCSYTNIIPVEKALCSSIEALMMQGKQFIENALFQAGGVNFSGSSFITLPATMTMEMLQYPTYSHVKADMAFHLLCYTRSKISDVMTFGGSQAVPESWAVYRMIHLVDSPGTSVSVSRQLGVETNAGTLLWAWHFLFKLQPKIVLPKVYSSFLPFGDKEETDILKVDVGLRDLLDLCHWKLLSKLELFDLLPMFEDTSRLMQQTQVLQKLAESKNDSLGMTRVSSRYNEENMLYLCPGHMASMQVEEGLTQVLSEVYGNYSIFLLSVDLPANELTEIPDQMFNALPNLTEFDCSNNFIEVLPASIGNCKKLYSLSLAENNITDLPDTLVECKDLYRLEITGNTMTEIPKVVTKLTQLKRLYASHMFLTSLPENIGNLVNLDKLYVNGNCFTKLPKSFADLKELTDLGLAGIPWFSMRKSFKVMSFDNFKKQLKAWRLDRWLEAHKENREKLFEHFDEDGNDVLDYVELGKLNAALFNMFPRFGYKGTEPPEDDTPHGFPEEIFGCTSLEYLNLYYHGIVHVPAEIKNLQELKMINVSHNPNLLTLPAEIGTISCLTRLEMDDCPLLKTPPKEIRAKGFSTTFAYLKRLISGSMPCKRTKLMLVGLGGAGKTSLVKALFSKDGKANLTHGEEITDGIDISSWTVKTGDESVTYSVWDFAGQTVYYNTHQFFLSNRAVYLLLWNVRLGYEHAGLDFWLSSISVQAPKAPIFVVGSHVDQVSKFEVPINEMRARYKQVAGFHFISSYTGKGITELKENLFDVTLQQQYMGEQIPEVWLTFESNVISERTKSNVIEYSALEKMASISGIFEKTEVAQAVQFLHELGSLQHFTTESLKSRVVINPQWIVDVMACVVSVKNSPIQEGRLKHSDIAVVWKDYPEELHSWLLKLTEEYDLTFPLDSEPVNLVPCLLPEKQPEFSLAELEKDSDIKESKMVYKFDYLPAGLFNRGQVRLHQLSDSALIWKKGSYLKKNGHNALLQQTRHSELVVTVQGPRPDNMLFLVHEVFEGLIAESFRGVTYDFLIPCPDCLRMVLKDPHMFSASTIRRAMELKAPFLQCIKYFHTISCVDLLACMPPDNHSDFDLHLVQSVRNLRDLRKDLAADIFMSYCSKDAPLDRMKVIHPATVCDDLQALGYKCWFPQNGQSYSIEEMARALTDASVFVVFISSDYVKDEECVNIFKYARLTLRKPMVVVAVGDSFEWKQSKLGILLSDEVFVNMIKSKKEVYKSKFDELVKTINGRTNKQLGFDPTPSCFFSYTWMNSAQAVALGTRSVSGAIGHGDPRYIKQFLEENDVKCWIDVERVGQNGLFDDIAEGLLSAKVVVVCVSDEYASSPTCCMEFRYAANTLKLPIVLAVVGTGHTWRVSEVGVLSLQYPIVSFQEKSETSYSSLLAIVNQKMSGDEKESTKDRKNKLNEKQKNLSFQELFELAQRKLLRQLCFYAEHQDIDVYPRLFVIDFAKMKEETKAEEAGGEQKEDEDGLPAKPKRPLSRMASVDQKGFSKKISELKSAFRVQRYCVHTLCEHEEGWHSVTEPLPLPHEFGEKMLDKYSPFVSRVTAVMKHNKQFSFHCLENEFGEDYLKWLEENPQATMSDYQQVYHDFRQMVVEADSHRTMGKLARCRLPNGKIIWLCEKHIKNMKVTVLSTEDASVNREPVPAGGNDLHMITGLRSIDFKQYADKFTSSITTKRNKDDLDPSDKKPVKLAAHVELLPDKKMPLPSVISEMKAGKKTNEEPDQAEEETSELLMKKMPMKKMAMKKGPVKTKTKMRTMTSDENTEAEVNKPVLEIGKSDLETDNSIKEEQHVTQKIVPESSAEQKPSVKQQTQAPVKKSEKQEVSMSRLEENQAGLEAAPLLTTKSKTFYGREKKEEQTEKISKQRPQSSRSSKPAKGSRTCVIM